MGTRKRDRKRKEAQAQSSNGDIPDDFCNFKDLIPVILSDEGMKPLVLKNLYHLLVHLSLNAQWSHKHTVGLNDFDREICHDGIKATFGDICELSNVLFKELEERFERLYSNLCGISANQDLVESGSSLGLFNEVEIIALLFRCCMSLLCLLAGNRILDKGLILLRILGKLNLPNIVENAGKRGFVFEKSVFRKCTSDDNGCSTSSFEDFTASLQFLEPYNPPLFFMPTMLEEELVYPEKIGGEGEVMLGAFFQLIKHLKPNKKYKVLRGYWVFVDELMANVHLRGYFKMINYVASMHDMLFIPHSACDTGIVVEAVCNHFIISFSDKEASRDLLSRLFYTHPKELKYPFRAPSLGITSAVSLLLSPIMASAPKYLQAHWICLVSETIDIKISKPDRKLTSLFLSAFEKSADLYMKHMSCLQTDGFKFNSSHDIAHNPLFESYISPDTKTKLENLISMLENSSNLNSKDCFFRMKSDLVSSSMRFVKECQSVYTISCQDEILAILSCLILEASGSYDDKAIRSIEGTSLQHIYLLASLLKLMSISLVQTIRCLRYSDDSSCPKNLKDFSLCKEYDFILGIINCFRDLDITLPLQQELSSVMSTHTKRHMDSKMMFLHFLGLMSLSFVNGLDCLVKACLLTILSLLNLFVFEEGDLDDLQSVIDSSKKSFSSEPPIVRFQEAVVNRNSSLVVASKFQKMRQLYPSVMENEHNEMGTLSSQALASTSGIEAVAGLEQETEETSNGEIFLKCMLKTGKEISDFDDLVGFVECKQGKDYSSWLKNRQRYRKWKFEKMAVLKWKKKKKTWKTINGKKN